MFRYVALVLIVLLNSCKSDLDHTPKEKNKIDARTETAKNIEVYYSENGKKAAKLFAPTMMRQEDSLNRTYFPNGIHLDMYDSLETPSSVMTSKYAELDHSTNFMKAKDSVVVISTNGQSLKSNELIWKQNERKLETNGAVELRTKNEIIYGDSLFADENLRRYVIKKVRGIVQVKK